MRAFDAKEEKRLPLLVAAVEARNPERVRICMNDPSWEDMNIEPYEKVLQKASTEGVRWFFEQGFAHINQRSISARGEPKRTIVFSILHALEFTAEEKKQKRDRLYATLCYVISQGADINSPMQSRHGMTPLGSWLMRSRKVASQVVTLLLMNGACMNQDEKERFGKLLIPWLNRRQSCVTTLVAFLGVCKYHSLVLHKDIVRLVAAEVWRMRYCQSWERENEKTL